MIDSEMKRFKYHLLIACLLRFGVYGDVLLQYDTEQCLGQLVEYQCTVTGGATLRWRILVNGVQMGSSQVYTDDSNSEAPATIGGGEFTVERLDNSPIISNISFTVQSSINGYTIQCEGGGETEQFNISIPDIAPDNVAVNRSTFTSSSVDIYWTESLSSSSICFAGYNYTVSSAALDNSIMMDVADSTSTTLNNLVLSFVEIYIVEVGAIYVGGIASDGSSSAQFLFSAPPTVVNLEVFNDTETNTTVDVTVMWEESNFTLASNVTVPPLMGYKILLVNSTDPSDYSNQSDLLLPGSTEYVFYGVPRGRTFEATVTAVNGVGMNATSELFEAPGPFIDIRPPPVTMTRNPSVTTTDAGTRPTTTTGGMPTRPISTTTTTAGGRPSSVQPTPTRGSTGSSSNTGAIAGGVAGGVIFLLIVVIILAIVAYLLYKKQSSDSVDLNKKKPGGVKLTLADKDPEIGDSYYDKKHAESTVSKDQPDGNGQAVPEGATYQDPKTIKREEAPTGDMYAVPEKKLPTEDTSATVQNYAELDLPNKQKQDQSPSGEPPVVVNLGTQQPVEYAELRNL